MITVNGEDRELQAETVAGLVEEMQLPAPLLLIEHNGTALRKSDWEGAILSDGDRIEILRISAGG
jgi:thiamine biosynthesis protein ThiS